MIGVILSVLFLAALWAIVVVFKLPLWIAALVTLVVVFGWAALFAWRRVKAKGAARDIEKSLGQQADAQAQALRPDQQIEVQAMQAEFQKAVRALKTSKLARGGKDALAVLPWYMIIGPPGAGKSTALRASGLKFPYLSARGGGVKGVGGTRNCEWWLTNDAVLLDTAGRYATEDDDHDEWCGFLDMLQRTRPGKPINGLIVAVSLADLAGAGDGAGDDGETSVIEMARLLRERVDEVMSRLQMVLPTYLLITKADLLPGFVESFADLRKAERGQIWGFTVPLDTDPDEHAELFAEKFEELTACAGERMLFRLGEERQLSARARIYAFPQQLEALRTNLATLVENLFAANAFQDTPILRGVYFTSGTQEGRTIDRVTRAMSEAFGIAPAVESAPPVLETKSYFLKDVFGKVIFPDRDLAVRNASAERRRRVRRSVLAAACGVATLVVLYFPLRAFMLNRELVRSTADLALEAAAPPTPATRAAAPGARLEPLHARLLLLAGYAAQRPPLAMRFGMYQGDVLLPPVRKLFAAGVRAQVIEPLVRQDVAELEAFARKYEGDGAVPQLAEHARAWDQLKLHLLLTAPRGPLEPKLGPDEAAWISGQVADRWAGKWSTSGDPSAAQRIAAHTTTFVQLLADDPALALPRHEDLVSRLRRVLQRVPLATLALDKVVAEVDRKGYDLTLNQVLGGPVPIFKTRARVPGAFTRRGYEGLVKDRLENVGRLLEPWVSGAEATDNGAAQAKEVEAIRTLYFRRYIEEWRQFLESITVGEIAGSAQALATLQDLTRGEPPPLRRLFREVRFNTQLGGAAAAVAKLGEGVLDRVRKSLGAGGEEAAATVAQAAGDREEPALGPADVERAFKGFVEFGAAPELPPALAAASAVAGGGSGSGARSLPLDVYEEQLAFLRDALQTARETSDAAPLLARVQAARTRVRSLLDSEDIGWRPRLESLLWPPLEAASRSSAREAAGSASLKWCSSVALPFRRNIGSRYPFRSEGEPASLADVAEFFRPNTGLLWGFYNEALRQDIQRAGDGFRFARSLGGVSGFRSEVLTFLKKAQEISNVLFPAGSPAPSVQLSVRIRPTPRVSVVWFEVDGQRFDYRNGPEEWHPVTWPGQGKSSGALLRVRTVDGAEETLREDGEWGFLRLLEAGAATSEASGRDFSASWTLPTLGLAVTVEFRAARSDTPFFAAHRPGARARLLAPLRNGLSAPSAIAWSGPRCDVLGRRP